MLKYHVESGPLKITLFAESAYEAALEAVAWWGDRCDANGEPQHRNSLADEVRVSRDRQSGEAKRFVTLRLLAQSRGESLRKAWEQLLCAA